MVGSTSSSAEDESRATPTLLIRPKRSRGGAAGVAAEPVACCTEASSAARSRLVRESGGSSGCGAVCVIASLDSSVKSVSPMRTRSPGKICTAPVMRLPFK